MPVELRSAVDVLLDALRASNDREAVHRLRQLRRQIARDKKPSGRRKGSTSIDPAEAAIVTLARQCGLSTREVYNLAHGGPGSQPSGKGPLERHRRRWVRRRERDGPKILANDPKGKTLTATLEALTPDARRQRIVKMLRALPGRA